MVSIFAFKNMHEFFFFNIVSTIKMQLESSNLEMLIAQALRSNSVYQHGYRTAYNATNSSMNTWQRSQSHMELNIYIHIMQM